MEGWFNAKELKAALDKAIDWTARHGDDNPYVQVYTMGEYEGKECDRLRVLVGFEDGITEFTGFIWERKEPTHFPYSEHTDD